ncbi:lipocalin-like domain-containing protein [Kinneretia asaccharophila]|uniref:Putative secreted hydrolase n=1 Tax=Roseateles asaccharophilus TaxID=582607 RepID=A0A4R6N3B1_9BURK|nr:lipocalin-like domain-containing protein [Roseateles asaccharophilus]MDN3544604.1 lipocalin-like domain-containing protein [Roseateles asaccharophilus]TDP09630.1 putative secreted hydrolase [Roseateles asaccharophilus]
MPPFTGPRPRRQLLQQLAALGLLGSPALMLMPRPAQALERRPLSFPRDHGAHPESGLEWWYLTGLLAEQDWGAPRWGFQLTYFRVRHGDAAVQQHPSRLAPRQLLLAHVALTDLARGQLQHDQRVARLGLGHAQYAEADTALRLQDWWLRREPASTGAGGSRYRAAFGSQRFALQLDLSTALPPLLQGEAGWSRKGPEPHHASQYYSQTQLQGQVLLREPDGKTRPYQARAWLDHEWSDALLAPEAQGWDWMGLNLQDGRALTAFRLRRADGSELWSGGSLREAAGASRSFAPGELRLTPLREWRSPASGARYPVAWSLQGPGFEGWRLQALVDAQEVDARASTGMLYWEGASALLDSQGRTLGRGYLELTGYSERMRLAS